MIRNACAIITSVIIECLQHRAFIATALLFSFFFNDTPTTEIYTTYDTLSLHDALPIFSPAQRAGLRSIQAILRAPVAIDSGHPDRKSTRLNSVTVGYLVCRLLLEKKKHPSSHCRSCQRYGRPTARSRRGRRLSSFFFFFNDTATTEIYTTYDTLSLHDALPISACSTWVLRNPFAKSSDAR